METLGTESIVTVIQLVLPLDYGHMSVHTLDNGKLINTMVLVIKEKNFQIPSTVGNGSKNTNMELVKRLILTMGLSILGNSLVFV